MTDIVPYAEAFRRFATEAENEAKEFTDRGLIEAIYILLRRNELAQQNAANIAHGEPNMTLARHRTEA